MNRLWGGSKQSQPPLQQPSAAASSKKGGLFASLKTGNMRGRTGSNREMPEQGLSLSDPSFNSNGWQQSSSFSGSSIPQLDLNLPSTSFSDYDRIDTQRGDEYPSSDSASYYKPSSARSASLPRRLAPASSDDVSQSHLQYYIPDQDVPEVPSIPTQFMSLPRGGNQQDREATATFGSPNLPVPPPRRTYLSLKRIPMPVSTSDEPVSAPLSASQGHRDLAETPGTFVPPIRTLSTRGRRVGKAADSPANGAQSKMAGPFVPPVRTLSRHPKKASYNESTSEGPSSGFVPPQRTLSRRTPENKPAAPQRSESKTHEVEADYEFNSAVVTVKVRKSRDSRPVDSSYDIVDSYASEIPEVPAKPTLQVKTEDFARSPEDYPKTSAAIESYPMFGSSRRKSPRGPMPPTDSTSNYYNSMSKSPSSGPTVYEQAQSGAAVDELSSPPRFDSLNRGRRTRKALQPEQAYAPSTALSQTNTSVDAAKRPEVLPMDSRQMQLNSQSTRQGMTETSSFETRLNSPQDINIASNYRSQPSSRANLEPTTRSPYSALRPNLDTTSPISPYSSSRANIEPATRSPRQNFDTSSRSPRPNETLSGEQQFPRNPENPLMMKSPSSPAYGTYGYLYPSNDYNAGNGYDSTGYTPSIKSGKSMGGDSKSIMSAKSGASARSTKSLAEAWSKLKEASMNPGVADSANSSPASKSIFREMASNPGRRQ
ncbi:hypothetical protein HDU67_001165 [Dinochytrium kinnereticum]|nr:hypothetical protein HDU67_001165 [Dinochytrium kinnereticum]